MKLHFIIAAIALVAMAGCKKEDKDDKDKQMPKNELSVQVENGAAYKDIIKEVRFTAYNAMNGATDFLDTKEYNNGDITFDLGKLTPQASTMSSASDYVVESPTASVSNPNAKLSTGIMFSYGKDDKYVGTIFYEKRVDDNNRTYMELWYSDGDCTLSGTSPREDIFKNMTLKKGWNKVYFVRENGVITYTTDSQSDLKWTFVPKD